MDELTHESPTAEQPKNTLIPFKQHQLAALHKCQEIEKQKYGIGILADPPGSGKTPVILALIRNDPKSHNIVVVPINIYTQWIDTINKFFGNSISYKSYVNYNDVSSLYFDKTSILKHQLVLTTPLYFNVITDAFGDHINRVFIDEIDSVITYLKKLKSKMLWVISASFTEHDWILINKMKSDLKGDIKHVTCKCQIEFVNQSFNLPPYDMKQIVCSNKYIDRILSSIMAPETLVEFNALDYSNINLKHITKVATSEQEAIEHILCDIKLQVSNLESDITILEKQVKDLSEQIAVNYDMILNQDLFRKKSYLQTCKHEYKKANEKLQCMCERLKENQVCFICYDDIQNKLITTCCQNSFCLDCITAWLAKKQECPYCRSKDIQIVKCNVLEELEDEPIKLNGTKNKLDTLMHLLEEHLGQKIIIFSDYSSIFKKIHSLLDSKGIQSIQLDGGNIQSIDRDIKAYREDDVRVLMTNSTYYGCGMNLENTTDVVILHAISKEMEKQLIGRAQRPGRESSLHVWQLLHENELKQCHNL